MSFSNSSFSESLKISASSQNAIAGFSRISVAIARIVRILTTVKMYIKP
ncbi:hypothetical protein [Nostoc cycadae]|nr:hypothetical protein [Nostoc cycadae]